MAEESKWKLVEESDEDGVESMTLAMPARSGVLVRVRTRSRGVGVPTTVAESLTFVPDAQIHQDGDGNWTIDE